MPLPIILGGIAAIATATGVTTAVRGVLKMKDAKSTMKLANSNHQQNIEHFEKNRNFATAEMDRLGALELNILNGFERFSQVFEKIKNKPEFKTYDKNGAKIPAYNAENLSQVSVGAGVLLGGIAGAAMGTAGGFAAAGATTAAVMALGTASTGTAIATLTGAAATNATLAVLGGGTLAVGGGGMALGTTILGVSTLGIGLLVGGVIFNMTGSALSNKADEAWAQMSKAKNEIDEICAYLQELAGVAGKYYSTMFLTEKIYSGYFTRLSNIVEIDHKTDYSLYSEKEKLITENTVLLVNLLYQMCKVKLVLASENKDEINRVNSDAVNQSILSAETFLEEKIGI